MRRLLLSPALLISATAAQAQISWLNPASGDWTNPANWAGNNVPDNGGEVAQIAVAGTYAVDYAANFQVGGLQLTNANATLNILPNVSFAVGGNNWTNNGLVVLNKDAMAFGTFLRSDAALTFNGTGTLRLNAEPSNLDTAQLNTNNGGFVITNSATHSVKGCGNLRIAMNNEGLFDADQAGKTLQMTQFGKSNTGTMRASNGGTLRVQSIGINNAGGQIVAANGSTVYVENSGVSGGSVSSLGTGVVQVANSTFSDVSMSGAQQVIANSAMGIGGSGLTNNGTLTLNHSGANLGTFLRTEVGAATLGGSGTLVLNAEPTNLDTAQLNTNNGGFVLTNGPDHTIRGVGRIRIAMVNEGEIRADGPGQFVDLHQFGKTNNNLIEATAGGVVQVNAIGVTNSDDAQIVADGNGSVASFAGGGVSGGTLIARNGGIGSISNSTFSNLTLVGDHRVNANTTLAIAGAGIVNDGLLTINATAAGFGTALRTDAAAATIGGSGTLRLNAEPSNLDTAQLNTANGGFVLTNGPDHTIRGTGRIRIAVVNEGVIRGGAGEFVELHQFGKTNNNLIEAIAGGIVQFNGVGLTNSPQGEVVSDGSGSQAIFVNSSATGGTLVARNGGIGSIANATFSNLTLVGDHRVNANTTLSITGSGITNNGEITINPQGLEFGTALRTDVAAATIDGGGSIRLNATQNIDTAQLNTANGGFVLTIGPDQTVRGTGNVRINVTNNGTIDADVSGRTLGLAQFGKTNNGTMRASNGGLLHINGIGVTNNSVIRADAGSAVLYQNSSVTGGLCTTSGNGYGQFANSSLADVTLSGSHGVAPNNSLAITGTGIVNNGTIVVNDTAAGAGTAIRTEGVGKRIDGNGTVRLNAASDNNDTAQLNTFNGGFSIIIGPEQTLAGRGTTRVNTIIEGRLSPGSDAMPINEIRSQQFGFTLAASAQSTFQVGGTALGQWDTLTGAGGITLDGDLVVGTLNGFVPARGNEFPIVTASPRVGEFDTIIAPPIDADSVWRIRYTPTQAILSVTCPGDIDGDHIIELPDLATLLSNYGTPSDAQGFEGDADGDGDVDLVDLAIVLIGFGSPCP